MTAVPAGGVRRPVLAVAIFRLCFHLRVRSTVCPAGDGEHEDKKGKGMNRL